MNRYLYFILICIYPICCKGQGAILQSWRERREVARALQLADPSSCQELVDCPHDYYALFRVGRKVSPTELKKARKTLMLKLHPDKNKDARASRAFDLAQKAYEELIDRNSRRNHDELLQWRDYVVAERRKEMVQLVGLRIKQLRVKVNKVLSFTWKHRRILAIGAVSLWIGKLIRRLLFR